MSETGAYFRSEDGPDGETLHPLPPARSHWACDHLRGPAVTSLLARAAETLVADRPELRPARATFELFRPARMRAVTTEAAVVRHGRRLALVDSSFVQEGETVARAHVLFLARSQHAESPVWHPSDSFTAPAECVAPDRNGQLYLSGAGTWTSQVSDHENAERKQIWHSLTEIVEGEAPTAFQNAAKISDIANLAVNWGTGGVEYINADVTLSMTRLPEHSGIGVAATHRSAEAGICIGSAVLFDRAGLFGTATISALANGERTVVVTEALGG